MMNMVEQAKEFIAEFVSTEYEIDEEEIMEECENNPEKIDIAYTEDEEGNTIQTSVNLLQYSMDQYVNGKLFDSTQYENLDELIENELRHLDYDSLVRIEDEDKYKEFVK